MLSLVLGDTSVNTTPDGSHFVPGEAKVARVLLGTRLTRVNREVIRSARLDASRPTAALIAAVEEDNQLHRL